LGDLPCVLEKGSGMGDTEGGGPGRKVGQSQKPWALGQARGYVTSERKQGRGLQFLDPKGSKKNMGVSLEE